MNTLEVISLLEKPIKEIIKGELTPLAILAYKEVKDSEEENIFELYVGTVDDELDDVVKNCIIELAEGFKNGETKRKTSES